jgi:bifunctional non-homologous end joining protein LigD
MGESRRRGSSEERLSTYRAKRRPDHTPEPGTHPALEEPAERWLPPDVFVVHQHAARRLHFDLRLALDGVLLSWAVPQGPSVDPSVKRLAVRTEDHPLEYADFEGVIPPGNYGAGSMILWDRGRWTAAEDPRRGLQEGKLLFDLYGQKLRGRWTLVRTKSGDWLWIKKKDIFARKDGSDLSPSSILSGCTVDELPQRGRALAERLAAIDLPPAPADLVARRTRPMLAETIDAPFTDPRWLFELKYDGYRLLVERDGSRVELRTRSHRDVTEAFPDLARLVRRLPAERFLLDGEVVVLDDQAHPRFQLLQRRSQSRAPRRVAQELPATYYAFDLLQIAGKDVRELPLEERKELLRLVVPPLGPVRFADHVRERGEAMFEQIRARNLEGLVAKRADAPYRGRRSKDWLKIPALREGTFTVLGYTLPKGSRSGVGSLHLGSPLAADGWAYAGRVGTGFSHRELQRVREQLDRYEREQPPLEPVPPSVNEKDTVWTEPRLHVRVRYLQWTEEGVLRMPRFAGWSDPPPDPICSTAPPAPEREASGPSSAASAAILERGMEPSNLEKIFWPEDGYTKGDLIEYHRKIAPHMLPWLADRPAVLARYPDGIEGKNFFQKNLPEFAPSWIRRVRIHSEHGDRDIDYPILEDLDSLLWAINMGSIPIHVWASRASSLERPDWLILDLDPKEAPFVHVVHLARAAKDLCDDLGIHGVCKTSGSTGLHVLVALGGALDYPQTQHLAMLLAKLLVRRHPDIATVDRALTARGGKVYVDALQNGPGKLLVAPYSVRARRGAPVSMPVPWSRVRSDLDPRRYDIKTAPKRAGGRKRDPFEGLLDDTLDLRAVLATLEDAFSKRTDGVPPSMDPGGFGAAGAAGGRGPRSLK